MAVPYRPSWMLELCFCFYKICSLYHSVRHPCCRRINNGLLVSWMDGMGRWMNEWMRDIPGHHLSKLMETKKAQGRSSSGTQLTQFKNLFTIHPNFAWKLPIKMEFTGSELWFFFNDFTYSMIKGPCKWTAYSSRHTHGMLYPHQAARASERAKPEELLPHRYSTWVTRRALMTKWRSIRSASIFIFFFNSPFSLVKKLNATEKRIFIKWQSKSR